MSLKMIWNFGLLSSQLLYDGNGQNMFRNIMEYDLRHVSYCRLTIFCGSPMEFQELSYVSLMSGSIQDGAPVEFAFRNALSQWLYSVFCGCFMVYGCFYGCSWQVLVGITNYNRWILSWLMLMVMVCISNDFMVCKPTNIPSSNLTQLLKP